VPGGNGSLSHVVLAGEDLDAAPRGLENISVVPDVRIDEVDAVVQGTVRETLTVHIAVRKPAVTDDRCSWFDPVMYDGRQCVGCFVRYRNKKCSTGPSFNTARHPLTLSRVSPVVLSPTELALVNLDGLVRTTNFLRAALHEHQHGFPAERASVTDGM